MEPLPQPLSLGRFAAPIRLDSGLVEQAVLLAVERYSIEERQRFHSERDPIYELEDAERRETSFQALHTRWFDRLGLADTLLALLAEQPSIAPSITACLVVPARRRKDEHADVREIRASACGTDGPSANRSNDPQRPVLVIQLLAATLIDTGNLERFLRQELYYVADMLDPAFGYDPALAVQETSGPLANLLRERHELLWRVVVGGRLAARGHLAEPESQRLCSRFRSTFPMLRESCEATFRALFEGPRPSHPELMRLARHPAGEGRGSSGLCPLCGMPAPRERLQRETLSRRAVAAARRDFADWLPEDGLCPHCADLYDLRERARPTTSAAHAEPPSNRRDPR